MYLVGSRAVGYWNPEFLIDRDVKDYDFFCTRQEFNSLVKQLAVDAKLMKLEFTDERHAYAKFKYKDSFFVIDVSFLDVSGPLQASDNELVDSSFGFTDRAIHTCWITSNVKVQVKVANMCTVYLMKLSHRFKKDSPHFNKTRKDILWLKSRTDGYSFPEILRRREAETYTNKLPNLNQGKSNFFDKSVNYVYDHDTIHEAVKHLDRPAYTYYIREGSEVFCSKDKFFELPQIVRLYGVLEESYVLALERAIIPHGTDPLRAFTIALEKVCTSVTSGWFREFAYNNYDAVFAMYHESFVDKFKKALDNGQIKPHVG